MATMHTVMKVMFKANNSVRHLPLAQLSGRGEGRAFAQKLRKRLTELLARKKPKNEFATTSRE
jgi:hypothetical protein